MIAPTDRQTSTSTTDKILLAAHGLPQPFAVEDLIVAAWRRWPTTFGLKGHAEYPDSNKICAALMGERGLVRRGWLERVERWMYRVTGEGEAAEV